MTSQARLLRGSEGVTELVALEPVAVHLVRRGANGFRELMVKGAAEPKAAGRRKRPTARLTVGP